MTVKKESIEINCSECDTRFRLWVPEDMISEWEKGVRISCVKCGSQYFLKKGKSGFTASMIHVEENVIKETILKRPAPEARAPEKKPVERRPAAAAAAPMRAPVAQKAPPAPPERHEIHNEDEAAEEAPKDIVLVIEDDRLSREMVENTLNDIGFRIISSKNGVEALKILRKQNVKLIVTDLYLKNPADPESIIDGEEFLKRAVESGFRIPAIITTGKDIIDDLVLDPKWFDLHVKGFIQKGNPFWAEELKVKIKEVMYKD